MTFTNRKYFIYSPSPVALVYIICVHFKLRFKFNRYGGKINKYLHLDPVIRPPDNESNSLSGHFDWSDDNSQSSAWPDNETSLYIPATGFVICSFWTHNETRVCLKTVGPTAGFVVRPKGPDIKLSLLSLSSTWYRNLAKMPG